MSIAVGDTVAELRRPGSLQLWNRLAGVNDEFADHHLDDEVGRHEGFPSAFGMAPLTFALLQTMLRDWVGDDGRLVSVSIQLRSPWLRGRTLVAGGQVTTIDGSMVHLDVWADDDTGTRLVKGDACVELAAG